MFPDFHFKIILKYSIFSNKKLWRLFNVKGLRGGAYYRVALVKEGDAYISKKKKSYSAEI